MVFPYLVTLSLLLIMVFFVFLLQILIFTVPNRHLYPTVLKSNQHKKQIEIKVLDH